MQARDFVVSLFNTGTRKRFNDEPPDDDAAQIWQEYEKLANLPAPPARIPRQHVKEFIAAAERAAAKFIRKKDVRSLFDVLRLPKTAFDPYLTRRKTSIVRQVLKDYPRVELPDPHAEDRKPRPPTRTNENDEKYNKQKHCSKKAMSEKHSRRWFRRWGPPP